MFNVTGSRWFPVVPKQTGTTRFPSSPPYRGTRNRAPQDHHQQNKVVPKSVLIYRLYRQRNTHWTENR